MAYEAELSQAIELIKAGQKKTGGNLLADILREDPDNERAWLWVTTCVDNDEERKYCLEQVLRINPNNQAAQKALAKIEPPPAAASSESMGYWYEHSTTRDYFPGAEEAEDSKTSLFPDGATEVDDSIYWTGPTAEPAAPETPEPEPEALVLEPLAAPPAQVVEAEEPAAAKPSGAGRSLFTILVVVLVVIVVLVAGGVAVYYLFEGQFQRLVQSTSQEFLVEYIVSGTAPLITMRFNTPAGDTETWDVRQTPYTRSFTMPGMTLLTLKAENKTGAGTVGCEIKVDGRPVASQTSSQPGQDVTCTGLAGLNP